MSAPSVKNGKDRFLKANLAALFSFLLFVWAFDSSAADYDGVPLPDDASPAQKVASKLPATRLLIGTWVGAWGGRMKHILMIESVSANGKAGVIYAYGENRPLGIKPGWSRFGGQLEGNQIKVFGRGFTATYTLTENSKLAAEFDFGKGRSQALMTRHDYAALQDKLKPIPWIAGESEFLETDIVEDGQPVKLEVVIFKPQGEGPFPLAVFNHGSTGRGNNPLISKQTLVQTQVADYLNARGWMVAFPQRRGRGKSDGLYDEGISRDRTKGYSCNTRRSLAGADRAALDLQAAITVLRRRVDVKKQRVLLGGISRGGALSVAYAGLHPEDISGVINFVGGWMGDRCPNAETINQTLFKKGGKFPRSTLWIYGNDDPYYSINHSRTNFEAFRNSGGRGRFHEVSVPGGNGHAASAYPALWAKQMDEYLQRLK